jgi:hypothetical protein
VPPYVHASPTSVPCNGERDTTAITESCASPVATYETCSSYPIEAAFWGEAPACTSCLLSSEVTLSEDAGPADAGADAVAPIVPTYGAAVVSRVTVPNVAGCIEQTDPSDVGLGCAMAIQAAWRCEEFACNPTCPVTDDPSQAAYFACVQAAASTVCKSYADPASACLGSEVEAGASTYQHCLNPAVTVYNQSTADTPTGPGIEFYNVAQFFCNS